MTWQKLQIELGFIFDCMTRSEDEKPVIVIDEKSGKKFKVLDLEWRNNTLVSSTQGHQLVMIAEEI